MTPTPETSSPRALFVVHTSTAFVEPFRLAKLLARRGAEPVFIFAFQHWTADKFAQECRDAGIAVNEMARPTGLWTRLLDRVKSAAWAVYSRRGWTVPSFVFEYLDLRRSLAQVGAALDVLKPKAMVMSLDLAGYDTGAYVKVAQRRGCKVLLASCMMSIGLDQAEVYYHDPNYHVRGLIGKILARMFPNWVLEHRGRALFRCPPGRVLAMELLGIAPPKPWIFNSSWAEVFNMESDAMFDYYAKGGIPPAQMVVMGSTTDDVMFEVKSHFAERKSELCRALGFPVDRPILLLALPPDILGAPGGRPECDFKEYPPLADFFLKSCCEVEGYNVVVAVHPSVPRAEAEKYERYGARVSFLNTAELIPLCEFYVASISSTIRWAIACGKPVVNYDVYRCRYADFTAVPGVVAMEEQDEFKATLRRMASDRSFADDVRQKQATAAARWGRLDGQSGERLVSLVQKLMS